MLTALNYLRECPIRNIRATVQADMLQCLQAVVDIFLEEANTIRKKGAKYFPEGENASQVSLDKLYIEALRSFILPHVLYCLERTFVNEATPEPHSWSSGCQKFLIDAKQKLLSVQ